MEEKRRRGRPKKVNEPTIAIKEEKLKSFTDKNEESLISELFNSIKTKQEDTEESPYYLISDDYHKKRDGKWDVLLDDNIKYFDPCISYELTGYLPINEVDGLDFDPTPFSEIANIFTKTGSYTDYPKGCKAYNDFWTEQYKRCAEGYTVGKYRITGDHYFFLNFYRMDVVNKKNQKAVKGQVESFPSFLSKQYEFFHYIEMCEYIGKDCAMLKARGLGFSEILACLGVRHFITTRGYKTMYTAAADSQLIPVLEKCWNQLNWLNMNTNGGMKRLRQKVDNILHKRASLIDNEGTEYGRKTDIKGIVADNPRKVRGYRIQRLIYEEFGSNPNGITSWIQGNALVELGGEKIGLKICGGTGGDTGPQLEGLSKIFTDPEAYGVLPYKNFHTRDGRVQFTGFFIPAHEFSLMDEYLDNRGVTDSVRFKAHYENGRKLLKGNDLVIHCAEHCFTPDEALLRQGENIFDATLLSDRITQLRVHKMGEPVRNVALLWNDEKRTSVKVIQNKDSKIQILEEPLLDRDGSPFTNLYVAGIDAIDMGKNDSSSTVDVSDFCVIIKRRTLGLKEPKYVAIYKDRPNDIRTAYENTMKLLVWYNCKALLEYTKITIQTYFTEKGKRNLFMARPNFAISKARRGKNELIGLQATENNIKHALELINMYINDYCYNIDFDEILEQLLNYSYAQKRKFDIVAALGMVEIADEELMGIEPLKKKTTSDWKNFGYYTDENGIKRKGIIPNDRW